MLAGLDLKTCDFEEGDREELDGDSRGASVDLYTWFYQFRERRLEPLFGNDVPMTAKEWEMGEVLNAELECIQGGGT